MATSKEKEDDRLTNFVRVSSGSPRSIHTHSALVVDTVCSVVRAQANYGSKPMVGGNGWPLLFSRMCVPWSASHHTTHSSTSLTDSASDVGVLAIMPV